MRFRSFADRVALGRETLDRRLAWRIIAVIAVCYSIGFFAFYPEAITNYDEAVYSQQARLLLRGTATVTKIDPFTGERNENVFCRYPVGTASLMAPFIWAGGWKAGYLVPLLSLLAGTLLTARWLQDAGRSPIFALLILGYPASLVLGRVTMSDVPSLAVVCPGLWLFWRGIDRPWPNWLAAGFLAGASMLVREPNAILFMPFFAGAVLRREWKCWALVAGGLVGVGLYFASIWWTFGFLPDVGIRYKLNLIALPERLPLYALGLLVFVPGGLILAPLYRGPRRIEVILTILGFVLFYLVQEYLARTTSFSRRIVMGLRYMIPVLPVIAFAMAESVPRLARRLIDGWGSNHGPRLQALMSAALLSWITGIACASVFVHWALDSWAGARGEIREAIEQFVPNESVLVLNRPQAFKFSGVLDRPFALVDHRETSLSDLGKLLQRHDEFYLVLLDRSDSAANRAAVAQNAAFLGSLHPPPEPLLDRTFTATDRLRIWRVTELRIGRSPQSGARGVRGPARRRVLDPSRDHLGQ